MRGLEIIAGAELLKAKASHHMRGLEINGDTASAIFYRFPPHAWLRKKIIILPVARLGFPPHAWLRN